ncbi:hypothetical protein [Brevibacillus daliensis]|uniref:hypothetical protein n=1 Tax=Brevibacillus daliensis TaxID=2892995 RepID=UPI001E44CB01|nr:hypothetical protein [Brevibacillus daliensis]
MKVKQKETMKKVIVVTLCVAFLALLAYAGSSWQQYKETSQKLHGSLPAGDSFSSIVNTVL